MWTSPDYDRMLELHREELMREVQHARLVAVFTSARHGQPGIFAPARQRLGQLLVAWGMRLQAFPADLSRIEYAIQANTPANDCP